ncbi:hypothetical protein ACMD2_03964 [Ananas comosus]|uniref:Uncharacterized protein n=1 Tax=Ananas comosus TaxID=4615 RepID=A0A199UH05_ANACO|nr:hypothetical protein ACMD2_03964 [Ananas comosus]
MMSRPIVLVFLLVILIITSQFEWKQQLVSELETTPGISQNQQHISNRQEVVKEKIILSQEKTIQRLNEFIQSLQQQLLHCRGSNNATNGSENSFMSYIDEIQRQQMIED